MTRKWFGRIEMIKMSRDDLNDEDKRCMKVMNVMERRNDVDNLIKRTWTKTCFCCFWMFYWFLFLFFELLQKNLDFYVLWFFLDFMFYDVFWIFMFKMQNQTRKYVQGKCVSNTQKHQTQRQPYKVLTRIYKDQLEGILDIHKVREAQICRWKKILPHSRGEMVTQVSSFTSQRYKVLWGLGKSDNISLLREVSFDSPPNSYTLPERWSWGHLEGWWNPQAGLLKCKQVFGS